MKLLKTGRQIGQAVKNVGRLQQIVRVFAKHGFVDVVDRMNLEKYIPGRLGAYAEENADKSTPTRLREAFEELGPTFVKLGQLLSTRSDLLPENYIEEFTKLQDNVSAMDYAVVKKVVESELEQPISESFAYFSEKPLAAASIGQVHEARLKNGDRVVVKIQRPEVHHQINTDVSLLAFLANLLEHYVPETRVVGPKTIVDEFFRTLRFELDYVVEANNMTKMKENLSDIAEVVIPRVYRNLSTHRILTLEMLEGIRVNDLDGLRAAGIDTKYVVKVGAEAFFKTIMIHGLFHGDLHGGNLFVLEGSRLGIVDFGIVGRLSIRSRDQLANMVMSLLEEDYENLCYEYAELGGSGVSLDFDGFQREVRNTLSPYMGLSLSEMNIGRILIEATKIATKYNIKVPGDWMMVFKAILTVEGMGRTLDPDFDLLSTGQTLVKDLIKNQYSVTRLKKELLWVSKDLAALVRVLPRQIRWMFKKFNSNDFAFEIKSPDLQRLSTQMDRDSRRLSFSILGAGLFIASSIALQSSDPLIFDLYPVSAVTFFTLGSILLLVLIFRQLRK